MSDYYQEQYRSYAAQNPPRKLAHYLSMVEGAADGKAGISILDVGCGPGAFLEHVARAHPDWDLHGTDIRTEAIEAASNRLGGNAHLVACPATTNPLPSGRYDVITAWDVLEHLESPEAALGEMKTWLNPGGAVVFVVPVYDGPTGPIISRLDKDPTHLVKRERHYWVELAESALSQVTWHGILRYLVATGWYLHIPTRIARRATPAILVVGRTA